MSTINSLVTEFHNLTPEQRLDLIITSRARRKVNKTVIAKAKAATDKQVKKLEKKLDTFTEAQILALLATLNETGEN
jgi:hypothetical protein